MAGASGAEPLDLLRSNIGNPVRIVLRPAVLDGVKPSGGGDGRVIGLQGGLVAADALGNVVVRDVREVVAHSKTDDDSTVVTVVGERIIAEARFVRGDSVVAVTAVPKAA